MRTIATALTALAGLAAGAHAQLFQQSNIEERFSEVTDLVSIDDGGYIAVGQVVRSSNFRSDMVVSRHDANGVRLWTRAYGSLDESETGSSVQRTFDGKLIIAGTRFDAVLNQLNITLTKMDFNGNIEWSYLYPATSTASNGPIVREIRNQSSRFAVVSSSEQSSPGNPTVRGGQLLLVDFMGNIVSHQLLVVDPPGDALQVTFNDVSVITRPSSSQLAIVGSIFGELSPGVFSGDMLLVRYNTLNGTVMFANRYNENDPGNPGQLSGEDGRAISVNEQLGADPQFAFAGSTDSVGSQSASTWIRTDGAGVPIWSRTVSDFYPGQSALRWTGDNVVAAGSYFFGDGGALARIVQVDNVGDYVFSRLYDPSFNTGFDALELRGGPDPARLLAGGRHFIPNVFGNGMFTVQAAANGSVGCSDALAGVNVLPAIIEVTPVPLVQSAIPGGAIAWNPVVRPIGVTSDLCIPVPDCVADVDDGSGTGTPDGGVGVEDLLYYLSLYDNGDIGADVDDGSATGTQDGGVGIEDLLYYLFRYDAGC
jgi:hypothetical protein